MDNSQIENSIGEIRKRSGSFVNFNKDKISSAIYKALEATSEADRGIADELGDGVVKKLVEHGFSASRPPSVEDIQDLVESTLIEKGYSEICGIVLLYLEIVDTFANTFVSLCSNSETFFVCFVNNCTSPSITTS